MVPHDTAKRTPLGIALGLLLMAVSAYLGVWYLRSKLPTPPAPSVAVAPVR